MEVSRFARFPRRCESVLPVRLQLCRVRTPPPPLLVVRLCRDERHTFGRVWVRLSCAANVESLSRFLSFLTMSVAVDGIRIRDKLSYK